MTRNDETLGDPPAYVVVVECSNELDQADKLAELELTGYRCRAARLDREVGWIAFDEGPGADILDRDGGA